MKKLFFASLALVTLTACSSVPNKMPDVAGQQVSYPTWYTTDTPPGSDALYAVATEYSRDMQFAVDKATLSAKRQLAANYSSHISAMMKDFVAEVGDDPELMKDISRTTKLVVAQVNLIGVQRTNFQVNRENAGYRAYVRLRYSVDESNRILMQEISRNRALQTKLESSQSFRELEDSVNSINNPRQTESRPLGSTDPNAPIVSSRMTMSDSPSVDNTPIQIN
jgi:hypothetical protein